MTIDGLKQWHDARPFNPFIMRLTNGRRLRVHHPEFLARSPSGRTITLYSLDESAETVDLLHVVSISAANGKRKARGGNGRGPKR
jgi:hypothetical protein